MDFHSIGGFADFLHKRGAFVFLLWHRSRAVCSDDVSFLIFAHITPSVSKSSIHRIKGLQRIMAFYLCPFGQIMRAAHHNRPETLLTAVDTFPAKRIVCHSVSVIQEKLPFQLAFLAHSRHENISFRRCGWIDGFSVVSRCCFQGKPALSAQSVKRDVIGIGIRQADIKCCVPVSFQGVSHCSSCVHNLWGYPARQVWKQP